MINFETQQLDWPEKGSRVVLGMSGGVDSSLTALLLKEHGCSVTGVTMSMWKNDIPFLPSKTKIRNSCYGPDERIDIEQCQTFCKQHDIPHFVIDVSNPYKNNVFDYFKREYQVGRTPNPCVQCNQFVKFGALLQGAVNQGIEFDYFCTGHYAQLVRPVDAISLWYGENRKADIDRPVMLSTALDTFKDQSYFLHRVSSHVLEKVRFPLSRTTKKENVELAKKRKLFAATRRESQDFIPKEYFNILFSGENSSKQGDILNLDGKKLGEHQGIEHYTIGQRRGLGVSANRPLYVHSINADTNTVVLCEDEELRAKALVATDCVWAGNYIPNTPFNAHVKIRLASKPIPARIIPHDDYTCIVEFNSFARAIAPGQSVAVYLNNTIVAGGIIEKAL